MNINLLRTRWAAIGAAVAVTIGAGGIGISYATSPAGAAAYVPITPCRLVDTRPAPDNVGPRNTPIVAGSNLTVLAHGANGNCTAASAIPSTATGLQLNVTGLGATTATFVTVWPTGAAQPVTSNLNLSAGGAATPNAVTTGLSADGKFDIANGFGSVNVIVDVVGYYTDHNHDDRYVKKTDLLTVSAQGDQEVDVTSPTLVIFGGTFSTTLRSVSVTAPVAGTISADASFAAMGNTAGQTTVGTCSITTGNDTDPNAQQRFSVTQNEYEAVALTRTFQVAAGSTTTLNLLCSTNSTFIGPVFRSMIVSDSSLNATFVPSA